MRSLTKIIVPILLIFNTGIASVAFAQQSVQERAASLRVQLAEKQARQDELQARMKELDEALKPENIAGVLAGVGSVHPEELREQRRHQLASERTGVSAELDRLAVSRSRLEVELQKADAEAYQQSAAPTPPTVTPKGPNAPSVDAASAPVRPVVRRRSRQVKRPKAKPTKPKAATAPSNQ